MNRAHLSPDKWYATCAPNLSAKQREVWDNVLRALEDDTLIPRGYLRPDDKVEELVAPGAASEFRDFVGLNWVLEEVCTSDESGTLEDLVTINDIFDYVCRSPGAGIRS